MNRNTTLPDAGGTYILVLQLNKTREIRVGKRGLLAFNAGWYAYVGSALGPGGLGARIGRHIRVRKKKRWHIDYLRARTAISQIWFHAGKDRLEHQWAAALASATGDPPAIPRFGCSDCRCTTHLFYFRTPPPASLFTDRLGAGLLMQAKRKRTGI